MRRSLSVFVGVGLLVVGALGIGAAGASAAGACTGAVAAITITGNLEAGAGCVLNGTKVTGNVTVNPGGSLVLNGATVIGNVRSTGASSITLEQGSSIHGNLEVKGATNVTIEGGSSVAGNVQVTGAGNVTIEGGSSVGGNVQISGASTVTIEGGSSVGGNVQIDGALGNVDVAYSTVKGNIQVQNGAACLAIRGDKVGGNLQVRNNSPSVTCTGGIVVEEDTVRGNVQVQNSVAATTCSESCELVLANNNGSALVQAFGPEQGTLFAAVVNNGALNCPGQTTSDPNTYQFYTTPPNASFSETVTLTYPAPPGVLASSQQVCFQAPYPFTTLAGTPLRQGNANGATVYTGLLPDCTEGSQGPCVEFRGYLDNEGTGANEIEVVVFVPAPGGEGSFGDPLMH